jgi:hypothetical protein
VTTGPDLPLACNLDGAAFSERRARWEALSGRSLAGRERTPGGVLLRYRAEPGVGDELGELVRLEGECCPFLELRLRDEETELVLEVSGPPEAAEVIEAFAS